MYKTIMSLFAIAAITSSALAGTAPAGKAFKQPVIDEVTPCFADNEFTVDAFAAYQMGNGGYYDDGFSGGVGVNYFFARYFGIGAEAYWNDLGPDNTVIHAVNGMLLARYPIDSLCLAPYMMVGGGALMNGQNTAVGFLGSGLEYRMTESVGIFGDGRYQWNQGANDKIVWRMGLRFAF